MRTFYGFLSRDFVISMSRLAPGLTEAGEAGVPPLVQVPAPGALPDVVCCVPQGTDLTCQFGPPGVGVEVAG